MSLDSTSATLRCMKRRKKWWETKSCEIGCICKFKQIQEREVGDGVLALIQNIGILAKTKNQGWRERWKLVIPLWSRLHHSRSKESLEKVLLEHQQPQEMEVSDGAGIDLITCGSWIKGCTVLQVMQLIPLVWLTILSKGCLSISKEVQQVSSPHYKLDEK